MSPLAGPFLAAVVVLALAGVVKVVDPAGTRVALRTAGLPSGTAAARAVGAGEVLGAGAALVLGGVVPAVLVAAAYVAFAGFAEVLRRRSPGGADCGCFGRASAPVSRLHVGVNLALAAVAVATLADPVPNVVEAARETPWGGVPFLALVALLSWQFVVALTLLPRLQAEVRASRSVPARRPGRSATVTP